MDLHMKGEIIMGPITYPRYEAADRIKDIRAMQSNPYRLESIMKAYKRAFIDNEYTEDDKVFMEHFMAQRYIVFREGTGTETEYSDISDVPEDFGTIDHGPNWSNLNEEEKV